MRGATKMPCGHSWRARLVAADDHRPAAQLRPVALLDGRVERVHVGVQDRAGALGHDRAPVYGPGLYGRASSTRLNGVAVARALSG
jgi:hypothetical protein